MRGLIVRKPFGTLIVEGLKKVEVRRRPTRVRGRVVIIEDGYAVGEVDIVGVLGPYTLEELEKFEDLHLAGHFLGEYVGGDVAYLWVLENPVKYEKPRRVKVPRGAIVFVRDVKLQP